VDLRVLLVSYSFPPVGGAGVQRVVKLAKYLPLHGVRPAVLTVANPSVPLRDDSLLRDVPAGVEVARARTLEPGYGAKRAAWRAQAAPSGPRSWLRSLRARGVRALAAVAGQALFPDPQVLWQPAAHLALARRLGRRLDDAVLISGPPFSQFLLAPLARAGGVGVVLDYRDEWSTLRRAYEMARSRTARILGDPLEAALLRRAHAVVTATEEFRENLLRRFPFVDPGRVWSIPNGYDPEDFPPSLPAPPNDRFVVTYAGTVFTLTSARGLLGAIRLVHARRPELARLLRVRFVGRIVDTELDAFEGMDALGVERIGYVPHDDVLRELAASHLTLCLLDDVSGAERVYPAKIFELMRLGRPVMTLAPPGSALARLVAGHDLGPLEHPRDEHAIAATLEDHLRAFQRSDNAPAAWQKAPGIERYGRYDRRALAGEFAEILREAASRARRPGS
jgi:glycosyltransferase involved in cell wall biosynthesis